MKDHAAKVAQLRQYLKLNNKRYTIERDRMLEAIDAMPERFTLLGLIDLARSRGYVYAASTLYRNFFAFVEAGLVNELRGVNGKIEYERNDEDCCYLHCIGCGSILKRPLPEQKTAMWEDEEFTPVTKQLHLRGYCPDCHKKLQIKKESRIK
ncbi:Fur family transcriptional regulator [Victivallis sp. Marseille-Q1083]|mgnify:CR=1 FL=1|uniref:Fur family transcriptional regulator n=1 Tax=Victivallis sp. Marseille-Q1083 TaxID=2717288 RepID=UPI00158E5F82|nr:transcriptional repressor [Victivallis sp. Marseille-Q1083]